MHTLSSKKKDFILTEIGSVYHSVSKELSALSLSSPQLKVKADALILAETIMSTFKSMQNNLPHGALNQAIVIQRFREQQAPTLSSKLQTAMSGPFKSALRRAASDHGRISKLKAPEGLGTAHFMEQQPKTS